MAGHQNKGRETNRDRAREIRDWMDGQIAAGKPVGEDEVWGRITTRFATLTTEAAESLLHLSMGLPPAPSAGMRVAMWDLVNAWTDDKGMLNVPVDRLADFVSDAARAAEAQIAPDAGSPAPGL